MANTTNINGTVTLGDPQTLQGTFTLTVNTQQTGSNLTVEAQTIPSGGYVGLITSSLTNLKYAIFVNQGAGQIQIAGTSGGGGFTPILSPGDCCIIAFSGSGTTQQLWAQSLDAGGLNLLEYGVQEF